MEISRIIVSKNLINITLIVFEQEIEGKTCVDVLCIKPVDL